MSLHTHFYLILMNTFLSKEQGLYLQLHFTDKDIEALVDLDSSHTSGRYWSQDSVLVSVPVHLPDFS